MSDSSPLRIDNTKSAPERYIFPPGFRKVGYYGKILIQASAARTDLCTDCSRDRHDPDLLSDEPGSGVLYGHCFIEAE